MLIWDGNQDGGEGVFSRCAPEADCARMSGPSHLSSMMSPDLNHLAHGPAVSRPFCREMIGFYFFLIKKVMKVINTIFIKETLRKNDKEKKIKIFHYQKLVKHKMRQ